MSTTQLCPRIINRTPITKRPVTLSTTLRCRPYTTNDTTMRREARLIWHQQPLPSLVVAALTPTMDTLRIITTSTTTATRRTHTDNTRTTHSLHGHPPLWTPIPKILTHILRETRTEMTHITSNQGMDKVNRSEAGTETVMGRMVTDGRSSEFTPSCFPALWRLSCMYCNHLESLPISFIPLLIPIALTCLFSTLPPSLHISPTIYNFHSFWVCYISTIEIETRPPPVFMLSESCFTITDRALHIASSL